jgi:hypothetical protein
MDRTEAVKLAQRLKRQTRNADVLALCDWVLNDMATWKQKNRAKHNRYMRDYMKRWRAGRHALSLAAACVPPSLISLIFLKLTSFISHAHP